MKIVAAILAGGVGARLRPALATVPKALAPVGNAPFISFLLTQLAELDLSRVVVCAGHYGRQFERSLESWRSGPPILISRDEWPMGTAGALRQAVAYLSGDFVLVLHGDSYIDTSLAGFCQWSEAQSFPATLLVSWVENSAGIATVDVAPTSRVVRIRERAEAPDPGWVHTGVSLLPRSWIEALPADTPLSLEKDVFPYWLDREIGACCVHAPFLDIGAPKAMELAPGFFAAVKKRIHCKLVHTSTEL